MPRPMQAALSVCFTVALCLTLACGSTDDAFQLTRVEKIPGFKSRSHYAGTLEPPYWNIATPAPKGAIVLTGALKYFPGKPVCAAWYETEDDIAAGKWSMVVDTNGNGNLTDDPILQAAPDSHAAEIIVPDFWGRDVPYAITVTTEKKRYWVNRVTLTRKAVYRGDVEIDGKKHMAVLVDNDNSGLEQETQNNFLFIDGDGDGGLQGDFYPPSRDRLIRLVSDKVSLMGRVWECRIDNTKPSVALEPYEGPVGRISLRGTWENGPPTRALYVCVSSPDSKDRMLWPCCDGTTSTIVLPAGIYSLCYAMMEILAPPGEASAYAIFGLQNSQVEIQEGKDYALALRALPRVEPKIETSAKDNLRVRGAFVATDDVVGLAVGPQNSPDSAEGKIRVYRGEKPEGKPFFVGSIGYG